MRITVYISDKKVVRYKIDSKKKKQFHWKIHKFIEIKQLITYAGQKKKSNLKTKK